ncbi:ATP synthase mitochondrial F1 complex assembly factor 1-like isoform X1 [Homarus americanus]|uniref:ATP synthase mitochondrial F1 complex assembly factor 1-like n=2 Tax=Homarus americanus TaxID=6706 RepID=A0A8J5JWF6_HOMAM|nr:ATP synthase mitochondrial F1 complex assembly factor 1-like isoform X1 [Homarus americanus]XP_042233637.1 ATP synthase mitochondrial F1 complex assembly factor 1-like isoform X1 [Homarus americanus]XP_042233638.1 ATP synthase mitochondrial F1 complex assembly factor 1-like isoform X1 [Homarus americanus]KAG7162554.1 ATP synthase mitochondrial F1 complex assembly factor 1-like [Homarus americanus]
MNRLSRGCCLLGRRSWSIMSKQPVSTSSYAMVMAIEDLEKNPYFEKYAGKIAMLQKESPEEFLEKFAKHKELKKSQPGGHGFTEVAKKSKETTSKGAYGFTPQKKLESVMKMDLLKDKHNDEIKYIWTEHFRHKDAVSAVIPAATYDKLHETALKYTTFLFPLPRDKGYEFIVAQFAAHEVHFTSLINYQAHREDAPECLTLVHYPDLKEERGIVFMHGDYDKNTINAFEAQFLVNQLQLYYGGGNKTKTALLQKFHEAPEQFKHMELVDQLEKLDLSVLSPQDKK